MTSTLAKSSSHEPHYHRPTSASSSSTANLYRATSFTSHNGSDKPPVITGLRTRSPKKDSHMNPYIFKGALPPDNKPLSPETTRRSSAYYTRSDSRQGTIDGAANLNRWSQSTASSHRSSATHHRKSSFSKRLSGSIGSFAGIGSPQGSSPNARLNKRPRSPPGLSPPASTAISPLPKNPPPLLPPILTISSLSQAVDGADSPSTTSARTPATGEFLSSSPKYTSEQDYFGDRWSARSPTKPGSRGKKTTFGRPSSRASPASPQSSDPSLTSCSAKPAESAYPSRAVFFTKHVDRRPNAQYWNRANSAKSLGTTEGESSASDTRDLPGRVHRRRAPSQKALLSKALAKANHAVVLDGKQNVEGAILAYGDACNLLRQVMVRSSGEDDRRKLEAVVSISPQNAALIIKTDRSIAQYIQEPYR